MLKINLPRLITLRGVSKPIRFLLEKGFTPNVAYRFMKNELYAMTPAQLEKICLTFNCTPNDLYEWYPDKSTLYSEHTALMKLVKETPTLELSKLVSEIPADKLEEFAEGIRKLASDVSRK